MGRVLHHPEGGHRRGGVVISPADRAVFDEGIARFKLEYPGLDTQVGVWLDLALASFVDYLCEIREDITAEERTAGLHIVAALAITETAASWQRTCRRRKTTK